MDGDPVHKGRWRHVAHLAPLAGAGRSASAPHTAGASGGLDAGAMYIEAPAAVAARPLNGAGSVSAIACACFRRGLRRQTETGTQPQELRPEA